MSKHTGGNWKPGKQLGTVVSDIVVNKGEKFDHYDSEYYGGYLICESIGLHADRDLIAAAPKMLEFIVNLENDDGSIPLGIWEWRNRIIAEARGEC